MIKKIANYLLFVVGVVVVVVVFSNVSTCTPTEIFKMYEGDYFKEMF